MVKARRGNHWQLWVEIFFLLLLVDMAFLFIGPPESTLVQRGGERESKTVHVKLPRRQNGKRKWERFFLFLLQECLKPSLSVFSFFFLATKIHYRQAVNTHVRGWMSTLRFLFAVQTCDPCTQPSYFPLHTSAVHVVWHLTRASNIIASNGKLRHIK